MALIPLVAAMPDVALGGDDGSQGGVKISEAAADPAAPNYFKKKPDPKAPRIRQIGYSKGPEVGEITPYGVEPRKATRAPDDGAGYGTVSLGKKDFPGTATGGAGAMVSESVAGSGDGGSQDSRLAPQGQGPQEGTVPRRSNAEASRQIEAPVTQGTSAPGAGRDAGASNSRATPRPMTAAEKRVGRFRGEAGTNPGGAGTNNGGAGSHGGGAGSHGGGAGSHGGGAGTNPGGAGTNSDWPDRSSGPEKVTHFNMNLRR